MKVFVTGATGFLGRALVLALRREGHSVVAWVRSRERGRALLGDQVELLVIDEGPGGDRELAEALSGCDAVVNLAGAPVIARWTARRRRELHSSRVGLTARLVTAIARSSPRPATLVSGSAVGLYGDRGDELLDERSAPGTGFLAELCTAWESAATRAEDLGLRVVLLRTGIVLGLDGGALPRMLPPFRLGLGGRLGSGRQQMPWIHVEDWVRLALQALGDPRWHGPVNVTAPAPVSNRGFTTALARATGPAAFLPVPALALRALLGGAAQVLLHGQRAVPARALALGFRFAHPTLDAALDDLLVAGRPAIGRVAAGRLGTGAPGATLGSPYLAARPPRYELLASTELDVPPEEAFAFFSTPENLGLLTPASMAFRIVAASGAPVAGSTIDYRLRAGPLPITWRTRFERWEEPARPATADAPRADASSDGGGEARFVDVQERGPYRCWWHEHRFDAAGVGTLMTDRVLYAPPLGLLGRLANRLFIANQLGDIFRQRALAIRLRFGAREPVGILQPV